MSKTYYYNPLCDYCGRKFQATRSDAKFCSTRCRVAHGREIESIVTDVQHVNRIAATILQFSQKYKNNLKMYEVMRSLQADLEAAIGQMEVEQKSL